MGGRVGGGGFRKSLTRFWVIFLVKSMVSRVVPRGLGYRGLG